MLNRDYFPPTTLDESLFVMLQNIPETREITNELVAKAPLKMQSRAHEALHATVREKYDAFRDEYYLRNKAWPDVPAIYKFMIETYQSEAAKRGVSVPRTDVRLADPDLQDTFLRVRDEVENGILTRYYKGENVSKIKSDLTQIAGLIDRVNRLEEWIDLSKLSGSLPRDLVADTLTQIGISVPQKAFEEAHKNLEAVSKANQDLYRQSEETKRELTKTKAECDVIRAELKKEHDAISALTSTPSLTAIKAFLVKVNALSLTDADLAELENLRKKVLDENAGDVELQNILTTHVTKIVSLLRSTSLAKKSAFDSLERYSKERAEWASSVVKKDAAINELNLKLAEIGAKGLLDTKKSAKTQEELVKQVEDLNILKASLETSLNEQKEIVISQTKNSEERNMLILSLNNDIQAAEKRKMELEEQVKTLTDANVELSSQVKRSAEKVESLAQAIAKNEITIANLKTELEDAKKVSTVQSEEKKTFSEKLTSLDSQIKALQERNVELQTKITTEKVAKEVTDAKSLELKQELEKQITDYEKETQRLKSTLEEKQKQVQTLSSVPQTNVYKQSTVTSLLDVISTKKPILDKNFETPVTVEAISTYLTNLIDYSNAERALHYLAPESHKQAMQDETNVALNKIKVNLKLMSETHATTLQALERCKEKEPQLLVTFRTKLRKALHLPAVTEGTVDIATINKDLQNAISTGKIILADAITVDQTQVWRTYVLQTISSLTAVWGVWNVQRKLLDAYYANDPDIYALRNAYSCYVISLFKPVGEPIHVSCAGAGRELPLAEIASSPRIRSLTFSKNAVNMERANWMTLDDVVFDTLCAQQNAFLLRMKERYTKLQQHLATYDHFVKANDVDTSLKCEDYVTYPNQNLLITTML
jgi:chromosome segregation ATPase